MKKRVAIIVFGIIGVLLILGAFLIDMIMRKSGNDSGQFQFRFEADMQVKDGRVSLGEETGESVSIASFTVNKDEDYEIHIAWDTLNGEIPGAITVFTLKDDADNIVLINTGDSVDAQMEAVFLKGGDYIAEYHFFSDEKEFRTFMTELGEEISLEERGSYKGYDRFGKEGNYPCQFTFEMQEAGKTGIAYSVGVFLGFGIGLVIVAMLLTLTKKGETAKNIFDERQELVRGKAFKIGFFSMLVYEVLLAVSEAAGLSIPMELSIAMFIGLAVGLIPFAAYSIWNDAYFSLNERKNTIIITFLGIGVLELWVGFDNLRKGLLITDGKLNWSGMPLVTGCMMFVLFLLVLIKLIKDKREEAE